MMLMQLPFVGNVAVYSIVVVVLVVVVDSVDDEAAADTEDVFMNPNRNRSNAFDLFDHPFIPFNGSTDRLIGHQVEAENSFILIPFK